MIPRLPRLAAILGLSAALAGCSNDPYFDFPIDSFYNSLLKRGGEPSQVSQQEIVETLSKSDLPVTFLGVADRESQTLLIGIEQNGPYDTYANANPQAITMRNGMITGTRGLSGDLMSTDEAALLSLVRARRSGQATYIQRFLTPEDVTEVLTYRCGVEPDKPVDVAMGLVQGKATEVVAACESADGPPFVDYYVVGGDGEILASRQWLGENLGYVAMHQLRR